jgi:hypothetical protein
VGFGHSLISFDNYQRSVKPWPVSHRCFVWSFGGRVKLFGRGRSYQIEFDSQTVRRTHGVVDIPAEGPFNGTPEIIAEVRAKIKALAGI